MSYLVLARKYRPQDLDALVGQQHIERALRNAIAMDRVAHAMLFCGARGTGKTSTARIMARMLNCKEGPTPTPCGTCAPCREIAAGNAIDVHELDAASNRGINEIRELREGVGYAPARDRHKVYIIDEAHMLTTDAANAFLKTLEEPPPHVIFILATTDPQRLPVTIRSRCQRFDFRRIRSSEVVGLLRSICSQEQVTIDDEALWLVAREGDGSMRDALSILDQVIAFGGDKLDGTEVAALLGVADRNRTTALMAAMVARDATAALKSLHAAHHHGVDLRTLARTLALEARDLLVIRLAGGVSRDLVDRAESDVEAAAELVRDVPTPELERMAQVLLELAEQVAKARHPRLVLELGVIRLCRAARLVDVAELSGRVEAMLRSAGAVMPQLRASAARVAASPPTTPPARTHQPAREATPPARGAADAGGDDDPDIRVPPGAASPGRPLSDRDLPRWLACTNELDAELRAGELLRHAVVVRSSAGQVVLGLSNDFHASQAAKPGVVPLLARGAERAFIGHYAVEIGGVDVRARSESMAALERTAKSQARAASKADLQAEPAVVAVLAAFAGVVTHVATAEELRHADAEE